MARAIITVGAVTSHGGTVLTGSPATDINGIPMARVGDAVSCPCKGHTGVTIATGDPTFIVDGAPVARHGDMTTCGATLIAVQQLCFTDDSVPGMQTSEATPLVDYSEPPIDFEELSDIADEQIRFISPAGSPLANINYEIALSNGKFLTGTTDKSGFTQRLTSNQPVNILSASFQPPSTVNQHLQPKTIMLNNIMTSTNQLGSSTQTVVLPLDERRLTSGEIKMCQALFGNSIDYSKVIIHDDEFLWFGLQPDNTVMTPNGEIYFPKQLYRSDYSKCIGSDSSLRHLFIHEMGHVWQHQLGMSVTLRGLFMHVGSLWGLLGDPYEYVLDSNKKLSDYNMEQQPDILADYYSIFVDKKSGSALSDSGKSMINIGKSGLYKTVLSNFLKNPRSANNLP